MSLISSGRLRVLHLLASFALGLGCAPKRWDLPGITSVDAGMPDRTGGRGGNSGPYGTGGQGPGGMMDGGKDASCVAWVQVLPPAKPSVLLLVDRSANTQDKVDGDIQWWRAENEALGSVLSAWGNSMNLGYLPFPSRSGGCTTPSVGPGDNDLAPALAGCTSGTCVSSSNEVPLIPILNDAQKYFAPLNSGPEAFANRFAVVLIGSPPTCGTCKTGDLQPLARNYGVQTTFIPFGGGLDMCVMNLSQAANGGPPLGPVGAARNGRDLSNYLAQTFKEIANESLCALRVTPGPGVTFNTVRVQISNGPSLEIIRDDDRLDGWASDGSGNLRIYGRDCKTILDEAASSNHFTATATITDAICH